jgi:hypothetical protein
VGYGMSRESATDREGRNERVVGSNKMYTPEREEGMGEIVRVEYDREGMMMMMMKR